MGAFNARTMLSRLVDSGTTPRGRWRRPRGQGHDRIAVRRDRRAAGSRPPATAPKRAERIGQQEVGRGQAPDQSQEGHGELGGHGCRGGGGQEAAAEAGRAGVQGAPAKKGAKAPNREGGEAGGQGNRRLPGRGEKAREEVDQGDKVGQGDQGDKVDQVEQGDQGDAGGIGGTEEGGGRPRLRRDARSRAGANRIQSPVDQGAPVSGSHPHPPDGGGRRGHAAHPFDPSDPEAPRAGVTVAEGVIELDTLLGGWERVTAGYLIEGDAPVLVETGSQSSVPVLLAQLDRLGLGATDLAGVVVTHIHLDHAGGVGDVARAFPNATVYVHAEGGPSPGRPDPLVDSASRVYGPLLDSLYGRLDPTPPERIHVLEDGEAIRVSSNRSLVSVDSPGHAKHHLALHDTLSGVLFAGDAVGVKLPDAGVLRPSTPPPDFDLDLRPPLPAAVRRTASDGLGPGPLRTARRPVGRARRGRRDPAEVGGRGRVGFPRGATTSPPHSTPPSPSDLDGVPEEHREKLEVMNGVHSNAAGLQRWLSTRSGHGRPVLGRVVTGPSTAPSGAPAHRTHRSTDPDDGTRREHLARRPVGCPWSCGWWPSSAWWPPSTGGRAGGNASWATACPSPPRSPRRWRWSSSLGSARLLQPVLVGLPLGVHVRPGLLVAVTRWGGGGGWRRMAWR